MRIEKLEIEGFGKLSGTFDLGPGLNLFFGYNEAGKSTLQHAILALLYGFCEGTYPTAREKAHWERFRPWSGKPYRGALVYILDNGAKFRLERSFETIYSPARLIDLVTGRDLSSQYRFGRSGKMIAARKQLGMTRSVFLSSAFISQGEVQSLVSPEEIGETIAGLVASGKQGFSARNAIEKLEKFIKESIGTERSRVTPLAKTRRKLEEWYDKKRKFNETLESLKENIERKEKYEEQLCKLRKEERSLRLFLLRREREEKEQQLQKLENLEREISTLEEEVEALKAYARLSRSRDEALRLQERLEALSREHESRAKDLEVKRKEIEAKGFSFEEYSSLCVTLAPLLNEEYDELLRIRAEKEEIKVRLAQEKEALEALKRKEPRFPLWLKLLAAITIIGLILVLRKERKLRASWQGEKARREEVLSSLLQREEELLRKEQELLSRYGFTSLEEVERSKERFYEMRPFFAEYFSLERGFSRVAEELEETRQKFTSLLREMEIKEEDFERALERSKEHEEKSRELEGKRKIRETLGDAMALRRNIADLKRKEEKLKEFEVEHLSREIENEEWEKIKKEIEEKEKEVRKIEGRIEEAFCNLPSSAEIEENIKRYEEEVRRLEEAREAANIAKKLLEESIEEVHRSYAPRLGTGVGDKLSRITGDRYREVYVDPERFSLKVRIPEIGKIEDIGRLSFGLREQVYFLLRTELAGLISTLHEKIPLFLDDPFVNYDEFRLLKTLAFLRDLSEETQILLFTKDLVILKWFEENLKGEESHTLHLL